MTIKLSAFVLPVRARVGHVILGVSALSCGEIFEDYAISLNWNHRECIRRLCHKESVHVGRGDDRFDGILAV